MNLVSTRLITSDVSRLASFYETLTGVTADRPVDAFAEIRTPSGTLAIGHVSTTALFGPAYASVADNRSSIVEFLVDDVDARFAALTAGSLDLDVVLEPTTMPWGNRSLLVRDPDGNLVNFFTPVTDAARAKFGVE
ncbi:VOC family protein [Frondihabitans australicus]|uniref:Glyoxalase/bleomycin resistance protein/dioxygenase superfamily protein n=1 Tax=Frondihabitans australicus TaxID=386892 RepID=A0A495IG28_9MICO|nr:VOC family protein [Frondihabitans australicus]RKR74957.1 glyoxalase/bleomycin resistance protein/dioxygenase superfamily protein [Frondihabitans australicus]